jgi:hypothetical protein
MKYLVKVRCGPNLVIEADYHRIEQGCLILRKSKPNPRSYPIHVVTFAPGAWDSIQEADVSFEAMLRQVREIMT